MTPKGITLLLFFLISVVLGILYIKSFKVNNLNYSGLVTPTPLLLPNVKINNLQIPVEVADTPKKRQQGLSGRTKESFSDERGMLFVFENDTYPGFWMKDMLFPIDIIWINDSIIIEIDREVPAPQPNTADSKLPKYHPPASVDYVLEVNAGFSERNNIKVGDSVELPSSAI